MEKEERGGRAAPVRHARFSEIKDKDYSYLYKQSDWLTLT